MITNMSLNITIKLFVTEDSIGDIEIDNHLIGSPTPLVSEVAYLRPPLDYVLIKKSEIPSIRAEICNKWTPISHNWYQYTDISRLFPCSWRTDFNVVSLYDACVETKLSASNSTNNLL